MQKIRQTGKKTHRQSIDRDCDSERVLDQEKEREVGRERDKEGHGGKTETKICVVDIFVPAAPSKRYHPSGSKLSHNSSPTFVG